MEDFRIDLTLGEGVSARTLNMPLRPFTLIGATTRAGLISAPLRDRFVMREHLDFYSVDELAEIIRRNAAKLSVTITEDASVEIARRSRGTPRIANNRCVGCAITRRAKATARSTGWSPMPRWTCKGWIPQGSTRKIASISKRSPACFMADPSGRMRLPTR